MLPFKTKSFIFAALLTIASRCVAAQDAEMPRLDQAKVRATDGKEIPIDFSVSPSIACNGLHSSVSLTSGTDVRTCWISQVNTTDTFSEYYLVVAQATPAEKWFDIKAIPPLNSDFEDQYVETTMTMSDAKRVRVRLPVHPPNPIDRLTNPGVAMLTLSAGESTPVLLEMSTGLAEFPVRLTHIEPSDLPSDLLSIGGIETNDNDYAEGQHHAIKTLYISARTIPASLFALTHSVPGNADKVFNLVIRSQPVPGGREATHVVPISVHIRAAWWLFLACMVVGTLAGVFVFRESATLVTPSTKPLTKALVQGFILALSACAVAMLSERAGLKVTAGDGKFPISAEQPIAMAIISFLAAGGHIVKIKTDP